MTFCCSLALTLLLPLPAFAGPVGTVTLDAGGNQPGQVVELRNTDYQFYLTLPGGGRFVPPGELPGADNPEDGMAYALVWDSAGAKDAAGAARVYYRFVLGDYADPAPLSPDRFSALVSEERTGVGVAYPYWVGTNWSSNVGSFNWQLVTMTNADVSDCVTICNAYFKQYYYSLRFYWAPGTPYDQRWVQMQEVLGSFLPLDQAPPLAAPAS